MYLILIIIIIFINTKILILIMLLSESSVISLPSAAVLKLQPSLNHDYVTGMKVTITIIIIIIIHYCQSYFCKHHEHTYSIHAKNV